MRRSLSPVVFLAVTGSLFGLCALIRFAGRVNASQQTMPPLFVLEQNVDDNGLIRVHEQGVTTVTGDVSVGNLPAVQNVRVTNDPLKVAGSVNIGTKVIADVRIDSFDAPVALGPYDISGVSKIRVRVTVNGSGTVTTSVDTDALGDAFDTDAGEVHSRLYDLPGTILDIHLSDPDGEQVFVKVFGS